MEKFKFVRNGVEKECHCHDGVYEQLLKEGWEPLSGKPAQVVESRDVLDREYLKEEADILGIEYPRNIKTERLYELVYEAKAE